MDTIHGFTRACIVTPFLSKVRLAKKLNQTFIHLDHDHHRHHNQGAECARPYDRYDGRFELGHLIYGLGAGHTRLDDVPRDRTLFDWYVSSGCSRKEVWHSHSQYPDQSDSWITIRDNTLA